MMGPHCSKKFFDKEDFFIVDNYQNDVQKGELIANRGFRSSDVDNVEILWISLIVRSKNNDKFCTLLIAYDHL
jgi:hypothetical protein